MRDSGGLLRYQHDCVVAAQATHLVVLTLSLLVCSLRTPFGRACTCLLSKHDSRPYRGGQSEAANAAASHYCLLWHRWQLASLCKQFVASTAATLQHNLLACWVDQQSLATVG